jgi:hypothetical protein
VIVAARSTYRAPATEWQHLDEERRDQCGAMMEAALAHQNAGRLDESAHEYTEVLALAPSTHDALHMLGVVELARGNLDEAERLIRAAIALREPYPVIEHNLQLVNDARVSLIRAQPEELAERALPILADLALGGPRPDVVIRPAPTQTIHLIGRVGGRDEDEAWLLRRLCELLGPQRTLVWATAGEPPPTICGVRARRVEADIGALPQGGVHVFVGLDLEYTDWVTRADAERVIVFCQGASPTLCLDQLRSIGRDGARRVELVLSSAAIAARFGQGHRVLVPPITFQARVPTVPAEPTGYGQWTIAAPPPWPVGVIGQNRRVVSEPGDITFLKALRAVAGRLHIRDPGRLRLALGADASVRFFTRHGESLTAFLAPLRCFVHRVDTWWDEGAGRELFAAMAHGVPVVCPRGSAYAEYFDDGVDGLLYDSPDEALAHVNDLHRAPAYATAIGDAARAKAECVFDKGAIETAYCEFLCGAPRAVARSSNGDSVIAAAEAST